MAEYKGIKGFKVQYLDQDPVPTVAGWSAGNNMNTARTALAGCRNSNSCFSFWWIYSNSSPGATEEYNGSTWTANPTGLNTARYSLAGCGTQTAGLAFGGEPITGATEEYDGSTWTANPTGLNTARQLLGAAGTQTAGLAFGGLSCNSSYRNQQKNMTVHLGQQVLLV
jgi:hypothetical protein